jgi:cell division transport system permease protein
MIFKISMKHLFSKPFSSFLTVVAISSALTLLGTFWTLVENLERVRLNQSKVGNSEMLPGLTVFADPALNPADLEKLRAKLLENKTFRTAEVIPSSEGLKTLESQFGSTLTKAFGDDTLPITIRLQFAQGSMTRDQLVALLNSIRGQAGVLDVDDGLSFASEDKASLASKIFSWASALLMIVFVVVALLVSHMIRLAFEPLQPEVETLKVLGASRSWVFLPLLLEGLVFGFFGGLCSFGFLAIFVNVLLPKFSAVLLPKGVEIVSLSFVSSLQLLGLALSAALVGALMTWPMVNRSPNEV